ncbi:unnamed protein product [Fasciola hepatica]|uniref:Uncharacterized protein n=1 Tax=Fasciola hepatica TaxID=6192 RepID=A0ABC9HFJ8_FASHE
MLRSRNADPQKTEDDPQKTEDDPQKTEDDPQKTEDDPQKTEDGGSSQCSFLVTLCALPLSIVGLMLN